MTADPGGLRVEDVFDRIVVINLPERADRRREMAQEFARLGLTLGGDVARLQPGVRPAEAGGFPGVGARGCFLSHLQVLKDARDAGCRRLLVVEDDVAFRRDFAARFAAIAPAIETSPWSLIYLGHPGSEEAGEETRLVATAEAFVGAHLYAVQGAAIADLADYLESCLGRPPGHPDGGPMHLDGALTMFRHRRPELTTYAVLPSLGSQRPSRSDIASPRWFDRAPLLRSCVGLIRRLRNAGG